LRVLIFDADKRIVSAKHAVITCEVKDAEASPPEFEMKVVDVSRNGLTLNGSKLTKDQYYALKDGDVLTLPFHLEYRFELNPEGVLPRATRVPVEDHVTPAQKKSRISPDVSPYSNDNKRMRESGGESAARGLNAVSEALSVENDELRKRVAALEEDAVKASARAATLEADIEKLRASEMEAREAMEAKAVAPSESDESVKAELEAAMKQVEEHAARVQALMAELEEEKTARATDAAASATAMETIEAKIESDEQARKKEVEALQTRIKEAEEKAETSEKEVEAMRERVEQAEAKLTTVNALERSLEKSNARIEKMTETVELQQQMLRNVRTKYETIKDVVDQLGAEFVEAQPDATTDVDADGDADMNEAAEDDNDNDNQGNEGHDDKDDDDVDDDDKSDAELEDDADDFHVVHTSQGAKNEFSDSILADVTFPQTETQRVSALEQNDEDEVVNASPLRSIGNSPRADGDNTTADKRRASASAAREATFSQEDE
jgi:pSer/pThr/pTyr-binding forkhead associated (FHA) protein